MTLNIIDLVDGNAYESGADGYIVKGGQGGYEYNWKYLVSRAEGDGKPWGIYWVQDSRHSAEEHKAEIKRAFPTGNFGRLGLWLDIEKPYIGMTDAEYRATPYTGYKPVESVWRGVEAYTGKFPSMYFGPGTWDLIMAGTPPVLQQEFADKCDAWIAHYTAMEFPSMRGKWISWAMWQWREGPDYNHVDVAWWAARMGMPLPPPDPIGGDKMYDVTVTWPNGCSVRPVPTTSNNTIALLPKGTTFQASALVPDQDAPADPLKQWAKIEGGQYAGSFVAVKYPPGDRCTVQDSGVTPPPPPVGSVIDHIDVVFTDGHSERFVAG